MAVGGGKLSPCNRSLIAIVCGGQSGSGGDSSVSKLV